MVCHHEGRLAGGGVVPAPLWWRRRSVGAASAYRNELPGAVAGGVASSRLAGGAAPLWARLTKPSGDVGDGRYSASTACGAGVAGRAADQRILSAQSGLRNALLALASASGAEAVGGQQTLTAQALYTRINGAKSTRNEEASCQQGHINVDDAANHGRNAALVARPRAAARKIKSGTRRIRISHKAYRHAA